MMRIFLSSEIRTYLPEVPEAYEKITISHLIHHTSGLREFVYVGMKIAGWDNEDKVTHKQILDIKMLVQVTGVTEQAPQFYWERSEIWNQN